MVRLAVVLAILAGGAVATLWAGPRLVPLDDLKPRLAAQLAAETGAGVTLTGPITVELVPRPRLTLRAVQADGDGWRVAVQTASMEPAPADLVRALVPALGEAGPLARRVQLGGVELDFDQRALDLPDLQVLAEAELTVERLVLRRPQAPLITLEQLAVAARTVAATGHFGERPVTVEAGVAEDARGWRLDRLHLEAGDDSLGFVGTWRPGAPSSGRVTLRTEDVLALRGWLEAVSGRPIGLSPAIDAGLDRLEGRLDLAANLAVDEAGWALDGIDLALPQGPVSGRLAWREGRIDAALDLRQIALAGAATEALWETWRVAPDLLADVERFRLDAEGARLDLAAAGEVLRAQARLRGAGATDLGVDGRLDPRTGRFEGSFTLVADALDAFIAERSGVAVPPLRNVALAGEVAADPDSLALDDVRLTSDQVGFRGRLGLRAGPVPEFQLEGEIDRATLPTGFDGSAERRDTLATLEAWGQAASVQADLVVRRLALGPGGETVTARLAGRLDRAGLWLTVLEVAGSDASLALTGGLDFAGRAFDGLGSLSVSAPGRLAATLTGLADARRWTLDAGRLGFVVYGGLEALTIEAAGQFGALQVGFEGAGDAWHDGGSLDGTVRLEHPDAAELMAGFGWPVPHATPLEGAVRLGGGLRLGAGAAWRGTVELASLATQAAWERNATRTRVELTALEGELGDLQTVLAAFGLWDADPPRWLERQAGAWPDRGPLALAWPGPLAVRVEATALTAADGTPLQGGLAFDLDDQRLHLERLHWAGAWHRVALAGEALRGERGVALRLELDSATPSDGLLATALGLGWLGPGTLRAEGELAARGTTFGELVADLSGEVALYAAVAPSQRFDVTARPLSVPGFSHPATLRFYRAHGELRGAGATFGTVDLFTGYVVATIDLDDGRHLSVEGPLQRPRVAIRPAPAGR